MEKQRMILISKGRILEKFDIIKFPGGWQAKNRKTKTIYSALTEKKIFEVAERFIG